MGMYRSLTRKHSITVASFTALSVAGAVYAFTLVAANNSQPASAAEITKTWSSGALYTKDAGFGTWRGEPATISGCFADNSTDQASMACFKGYDNWTGDFNLAPGLIRSGETYAAAANGAYDARWRSSMGVLRAEWGSKKTVWLRPAHELNGDWFTWSVDKTETADFKKTWIRYHGIVQEELVNKGYDAKFVINLNKDAKPSAPTTEELWPGDQYVDAYGVNFYDVYPTYKTQTDWNIDVNKTRYGSPAGIKAHQAFAASHGKPMVFPEWGANHKVMDDNPFYIKKMHEFFAANAGSGPGQVLWETYFNSPGWDKVRIYPTTSIPKVAEQYRALTFGTSTVTVPDTTPVPAPAPAPVPAPVPAPAPAPAPTPVLTSGKIIQTGNLAKGRVFTSSVGPNVVKPNNPPAYVNDANEATRWISLATDDARLTTDLGAMVRLVPRLRQLLPAT